MVETDALIDRILTPRDVLAETPIFHALRSADTPIFDALVTGETVGRRRSRTDDEQTARTDAPRVDPMSRFRRDPLTAPIPVQAYAPSRPGPYWPVAPIRPWPEHSHGPGRHRLLSTV